MKRILRESYDRSAARYDAEFRALQRPKFEALLGPQAEAIAGVRTALDLGCGTGLLAEWLAGRGTPRLFGLDLSHEMLLHARGRGLAALVEGDLERLPFRDARFDAVLAFTSIGIAGPRDRALLEAARVLRPGGLLGMTVLRTAPGAADIPRELAAAGLHPGPRVECGQDWGWLALRAP